MEENKHYYTFHMFYYLFYFIILFKFDSIHAQNADTKNEVCSNEISLEDFKAYSFNNSHLVSEIDKDYALELSKAIDTETLANPDLSFEQVYTGMKLGGANDSQTNFAVSQNIRISNFGARGRVADLIRKASDLNKRASLIELNQKLTMQYNTLLVLEKVKSIILEAEKSASKKVALIKKAFKEGLLTVGDEKLFEAEQYRLQSQGMGIEAKINTLSATLSRSIGAPCIKVMNRELKSNELPTLSNLIEKAKNNEIGESARVEILNNLAEEQIRLAVLDSIPQLSPRFVYQHTNDGGDFFGAGISIPLPLWNRNQSERLRADSEHKLIAAKKSFLTNDGLESQIRYIRDSATLYSKQSGMYSEKVIPSYEAALKSQEKLYEQGKGSILQVWQASRILTEERIQGVYLWLEAASASIQLSTLIGEDI